MADLLNRRSEAVERFVKMNGAVVERKRSGAYLDEHECLGRNLETAVQAMLCRRNKSEAAIELRLAEGHDRVAARIGARTKSGAN